MAKKTVFSVWAKRYGIAQLRQDLINIGNNVAYSTVREWTRFTTPKDHSKLDIIKVSEGSDIFKTLTLTDFFDEY